jgi:hypothetical protein
MARPGAPAPRSADDPWLCGPASLRVCYFVGSASRPLLLRGLGNGRRQHGDVRRPSAFHPRTRRSVPFGYPGGSARDASTWWQGAVGMRHGVAHAISSLGEGPSAAQQAICIGHVAWQRPIRLPAVPVVRRASPPGREGCNLPRQSADTSTARPRARSASRIGRTWTAQPEVAEQVLLDRPPGRGSGRVEAEGQVGGRAHRSSSRTTRPPRALSRP